MEKGDFRTKVNNIISDGDLSLELHFVIKNADKKYVPYIIDIDDVVKTDLIEAYSSELDKYSNATSPFELHYVLAEEGIDEYVLYFDKANNTNVSIDIFDYKNSEVEKYAFEHGGFSNIFGFLISIYSKSEEKEIRIFKKNIPTAALKKTKIVNLFKNDNGKFSSVQRDSIYFGKSIDIFRLDDTIFIRDYNTYESSFGFDVILKKKLKETLKLLLKVKGFHFTDKGIENVSKLSKEKQRKLVSCVTNNPILVQEKFKAIKSQAKRYLKHEFKTTNDDKLIIDTKKDVDHLITTLNREINKNSASNEVFLTPRKKLIGQYTSKK